MRKFWLKYGIYGCILGLMGCRIWTRAHEERTVNLRPVFQPDNSVPTLSPADFYQNIQPIGHDYVRRPIYRNNELSQAVVNYIVCNGKTYRNMGELFQEMKMQALEGGSCAKYNNMTITTARK